MKKFFYFLALFCFLSVGISAQSAAKNAEKNPLDCALYLIKLENKLSERGNELEHLAVSFWKSGRRKEALEIVELNPDEDKRVVSFVNFAKELKAENKLKEFEELYLKAFADLKRNENLGSVWKREFVFAVEIVKILTELSHEREVFETVNEPDFDEDDNKAFILLAVADGFLTGKRKEKAVELLPMVLQFAGKSEWKDLELLAKAKAGTIYLKAGDEKKSEKLYEEVLKSASSIKEVENIFVDDLWREVFEGYKSVNKFDKAIETLLAYQQTGTLNSKGYYTNSNSVETYLANNQKEKAVSLMRQIVAEDDGFDSLWVTKTFLKIGDEDSAKNIFSTTRNDYYQQQIALELANYYESQGKIEFAANILNLAFNEAEKIESDAPESGLMSSSPAMEKARYLSDIAQKFIDLKQFVSALKIIQTIEKPFFKAQMLTILAEKQNSKNSIQLLNQAHLLMRKKQDSLLDAPKYWVWNKIAHAFAKVGDKSKAGVVFAEILSKDMETYSEGLDGYLLENLAETGFYFETAELKSNEKVSRALRNIIKNWKEENY